MAHEPHSLTAADIRALRAATRIVIDSQIDDEGRIETAEILVERKGERTTTQVRLPPVWAFCAYSGNNKSNRCDRHKGGRVLDSIPVYDPETIPTQVGTVLQCLKQGDHLSVCWVEAGNTSPVMEEHGLIRDQLVLRVHRPQKGGKPDKVLLFELDQVITVQTSTARWFHKR